MNKDLIKVDDSILNQIQETIDSCLPICMSASQSFQDSLVIANGLNQMRELFKNPQIKALVEAMQDTTLGFLTDRPKGKKRWDKRQNKYVESSYNYEEISEALIPMMLEGYRFTGNEINIIAGKGMPVKNGKYRKITELTEGFYHSVGTPKKEEGIAKMRCQAKWIVDGKEQTIGYGDDICIIAVEYDEWAGLDKLVGLAESKLYSRVLTRITGKFIAEGDIVVLPPDQDDKSKMGKTADNLAGKKGKKTDEKNLDAAESDNPESLGV